MNFNQLIKFQKFYFLATSFCINPLFGQNFTIFYEDFDGGLPAEWTLRKALGNDDPTASWQYTTNGPSGDYPIDPISSTSAENGWMMFDSDKNCNIGVGQDAWLISPEINVTGLTELYLSFETYYRNFYDKPQLKLGLELENFENWTTIEVFPDIQNNQFSGILEGDESLNPHQIIIDITSFATGQSSIYFAFQFLSDGTTAPNNNFGCGYSWQIDDVILTDGNPGYQHDLRLSQHNVAPNYATPLSQVDSIFPSVLITNAGIATQTGIVATVTIEDENQDVLYTYEEAIADLPSQESVLLIADDQYLPEMEGSFNIIYAVTQDSIDEIPNNNIIEQGYIITNNLFSKDDNAIVSSHLVIGESAEFWEGGCYYYVPNDGYLATEAIISVASNNGGQDHLGQTVSLLLYEIKEDEDTLAFTSADTEIIGFGTFTFTDEANFIPVNVPLFSLDGGEEPGVELTGGKEYILMVQYTPEMNAAVSQLSYPYGISTVIKDGETWYLGGFANGNTLVARLKIENIFKSECSLNDQNIVIPNINLQSQNIAVSNTISSSSRITNNSNVNLSAGSSITLTPGFTVENGATFSAKIQDCITEVPSVILEKLSKAELDQNITSHFSNIFPNPFNNQVNIKLNNYDEDFLVQIFDLTGREIGFLKGYKGESLSMDLSSYDAGIYFVKITGKTFTETKSIVKD